MNRPHPHKLVGKDGCKNGISRVCFEAEPEKLLSFQNLGIQCVKKNEIDESLAEKQVIRLDPFNSKFSIFYLKL